MFDLHGMTALVTGASGGIGSAIARALARQGARLAVSGSNAGKLRAFREELDEHTPQHLQEVDHVAITCDLANPEAVEKLVPAALESLGKLDILVNNAGITIDRTVRKMSVEDWDRVIHVNLSGAFYLSRAVLQHMLDRGYGRIINISSVIGEKGNIGQANYAAAKSGLFGLTNSLALETARKGITVNSVAPGFIGTEMVSAMPEEALQRVIAQIPVGRLGEPDEIARVVEFLADPESGYITGEVYGINGGLYM
jgi:3-oxoacyl-[acyl-carrier protein] reductase